jgi:predicted transcriptional regulator
MQVQLTPELARKLTDLAAASGRAPDQLVEDAVAAYLEELVTLRNTLDGRYDDLKSGRVGPISGDDAERRLREKSDRRRAGK